MPSCVAYGCSNRISGKSKRQKLEEETQKVSFHRFPKCPERQKAWVRAINRDKWTPSPRSVICSVHFEEKYFDRTSLVYVRLRENAVPTIFKSFPTLEEVNTEIHTELDIDHDYIITDFTVKIIGYIAGFILKHLKKRINCEHCLFALEGNESDDLNSLVSIKNRGGLSFASQNLIRVCEECEKIVRCALRQSGGKFMLKKFSVLVLVNKVLSCFISTNIFDCLINHCYDQSPLDNHRMHLIRAIAFKYFDIRLRNIGKRAIDNSESNRQRYNKLILFQGQ